MTEPIVIKRTINASPERVWRALTEADQLKQWCLFFPDFKAEVGFETSFMLGPDDHKYKHVVKVTEVEAGKKLTYGWRYEDYEGDSYVTFELTPEGADTHLTLTHTITEPFPDNDAFSAKSFTSGWTYTADGLKQFVEGGK